MRNLQYSSLKVGWIYNFTTQINSGLCITQPQSTVAHPWGVSSHTNHLVVIRCLQRLKMGNYIHRIITTRLPQPKGRRPSHWLSIPSVGGTALDSVGHKHGSFLKDPWLVLGDSLPDVSNKNIIIYEFRTSHMSFMPKQTRKSWWNRTRHTRSFQGNTFEHHGRLTSKLHETWHDAYI